MPYTPPSHNSPASSKSTSPAVSRSSSYCEDGPFSPVTGRPSLPRSLSSASYLNRHRRTPSISYTEMNQAPPTPTEGKGMPVATDFAPSASLRQSPPPVNNLLIPTGAIISPPDSSENSDGDEAQEQSRGRALEIKKLQDAVRVIDLKREPSPENSFQPSHSAPVSETVSPTALSATARKISHSRSATETAIVLGRSASFESPANTSDDSEEDASNSKPALVRKKSGELVKPALRPSSRRRYSSMPGTPTYSKSVHFNDNDNQTRHFLQVDKPIAVSAGTSPVEVYDSESEYPFEQTSGKAKSQRSIKLANFPEDTFERRTKPVRVERIFLSSDKQTLIGTCAVQNIAFHKLVVARFTLDYWKTTSEVVAEYHNDPRNPSTDGCDRFNFHIKLSDAANIDDKTLLLCVRYAVNSTEYWDNNDDMNYQIDFIKSASKVPKVKVTTQNARPQSSIPRSRHTPITSTRGGRQSVDDEFEASFGNNSSYHFGTPDFIAESPSTIKLKPKTKQLHPAVHGTSKNLGGRYDFGASLSAALTHAQEKLGRHSGLLGASEVKTGGSYFGPQERKDGPSTSNNDKPNLGIDRPAMGSDQYRDLVQKFCYFTSSGSGKGVTSPTGNVAASAPETAKQNEQVDGTVEAIEPPSQKASKPSSTSSPPVVSLDGAYDLPISPALSQYISQSSSPAPQSYSLPPGFGFPFHTHRDGYFNESAHHQTAIQG